MHEVVHPNAWVALKLPSESTKLLQVIPNTTISLGKYGSFPSNLIIERPYHLTYELQDKRPDENFCRLRIVPPSEQYADIFADEASSSPSGAASLFSPEDDSDRIPSATDGIEYSSVEGETDAVVARSNTESVDSTARQKLTQDEIETLKQDGTGAGRDLIAKLMLSHTALDQKTAFSLAKYKLLKTKKYIRRFTVLPLDVYNLSAWHMGEKEATRILELREELVGLLGCWANVHFGGESVFFGEDELVDTGFLDHKNGVAGEHGEKAEAFGGRWLMVDDTGGLLTAAMAERMGILHQTDDEYQGIQEAPCRKAPMSEPRTDTTHGDGGAKPQENGMAKDISRHEAPLTVENPSTQNGPALANPSLSEPLSARRKRPPRKDDLHIPYSRNNTLTLITSSAQPNLSLLKYFGYDSTNPDPPPHPLTTHLLPLTWLQLLNPEADLAYSTPVPTATAEELASWKPVRRGNYHRKRRRWARMRHIVHTTRAGGFAGLVVASAMDPISILRHTLPLLVGGAAIAIYSPSLEPLAQLADCFSVGRRGAWVAGSLPAMAVGRTAEELERWEGSDEFPLNPTLVLSAGVQTSRARRWQVLPGRTHPLMAGKGGAEGYVFTGWRAMPAAGKVEARGKCKKRKVEPIGVGSTGENEEA